MEETFNENENTTDEIVLTEAGQETVPDVSAPKQKKTFKEISIQFLKFTAFSLGAGIIQILSFTLFNEVVFKQNYYWISYTISLVLSVLYNFTVNRRFTFKSAANVPLAMLMVFLFYCAFAPYSIWLEHYLTVTKGWDGGMAYLVTFINMVQNLILEFLWCRFVVYRKNINDRKDKK